MEKGGSGDALSAPTPHPATMPPCGIFTTVAHLPLFLHSKRAPSTIYCLGGLIDMQMPLEHPQRHSPFHSATATTPGWSRQCTPLLQRNSQVHTKHYEIPLQAQQYSITAAQHAETSASTAILHHSSTARTEDSCGSSRWKKGGSGDALSAPTPHPATMPPCGIFTTVAPLPLYLHSQESAIYNLLCG